MDVEGDFFGGGRPVLVAEAVDVFAVGLGGEGVVTGGDGARVDFVGLGGILNLKVGRGSG